MQKRGKEVVAAGEEKNSGVGSSCQRVREREKRGPPVSLCLSRFLSKKRNASGREKSGLDWLSGLGLCTIFFLSA